MHSVNLIKCPICSGKKVINRELTGRLADIKHPVKPCDCCNGTGWVTPEKLKEVDCALTE